MICLPYICGDDSLYLCEQGLLAGVQRNVLAMAVRTLAPFELMLSSVSVDGVSALKRPTLSIGTSDIWDVGAFTQGNNLPWSI
jgi:hypothetical protein